MRKQKYKGRCEKRILSKSDEVCRFYSDLQSKYADKLDSDNGIKQIHCNVYLCNTEYMSDFLCTRKNGDVFIRECVERRFLNKPMTIKMLTIDVLIGKVAQLCLNHIGVLIIDEIQNIAISKNGKMLIRSLTQLINNSGVSICMVGIPECEDFFTQEMYLARRCTGLKYNKLSYENFKEICCVIWKYQFTTNITELNKDIIDWLYYYTDGIVAILIQLVHDSQEFCIINNIESLTINILDKVYSERFSFIKPHINNEYIVNFNKNKTRKKEIENTNDTKYKDNILEILLQESKNKNKDMIALLKTVCKVEEIKI